jgi:hypothetical protein
LPFVQPRRKSKKRGDRTENNSTDEIVQAQSSKTAKQRKIKIQKGTVSTAEIYIIKLFL